MLVLLVIPPRVSELKRLTISEPNNPPRHYHKQKSEANWQCCNGGMVAREEEPIETLPLEENR